jgi:hypothetical protein
MDGGSKERRRNERGKRRKSVGKKIKESKQGREETDKQRLS